MKSRFLPSYALALGMALGCAAGHAAVPVAVAGADQFGECVAGVAKFTLDGTGSSDADNHPLTYTWTGPFGAETGAVVEVEVPLGNNEITLEVDDGNGGSSQALTHLIVVDTNPPAVGVSLNPSLLIPPDGSFRDIEADVHVQDVCDMGTSFTLHSITSNEPVTQIVVNADYGTPDTEFILGALLTTQGNGTGSRTYSVFYEGEDAQGNVAIGSGEALVAKEGVLDVTPSKLVYRYWPTRDDPPSQSFKVSSIVSGSFFEVSSDQPWVRLSKGSGHATATIHVSVDPSELGPGSHRATLMVTSEHGMTRTVRVQLFSSERPEVFAMPEALSFQHDVSVTPSGLKAQSAPQTESIFVGAMHSSAPFTVSTSGPWLAASGRGNTPSRISVSASGDGMEIGEYAGWVRISPEDPQHEDITVPVTLSVIASRGIQAPEYLVNAATMERRPLAPGSLVTGFWDNPFGEEATAEGLPLPESLGGVSATIGGAAGAFQLCKPHAVQCAVADGPANGGFVPGIAA